MLNKCFTLKLFDDEKKMKKNGLLYKIIYIVLVHFPEYKKAIAT